MKQRDVQHVDSPSPMFPLESKATTDEQWNLIQIPLLAATVDYQRYEHILWP